MSPLPTLSEERRLWQKGYRLVIGIDEVGRGAFAGPIVVSACAFTPQDQSFDSAQDKNAKSKKQNMDFEKIGINDSKKLNPLKRHQLARLIKQYSLAWSVAEIGVSTINRVGIGKATFMAMRKAVTNIMKQETGSRSQKIPASCILPPTSKVFLLIDAFHIKYVRGIGFKNQKAIIKGDQKSISIAAASILAKVHRDRVMTKLHSKYRKYGWKKNKGYGTREHQRAIKKHGITKHHRKQFVETWEERSKRKAQRVK